MYTQLNSILIDVIKQRFPLGESLVNSLADTLSLGKEAIYRRLRNEVPFTLEEAIKISQRFGVSLDQVASMTNDPSHAKWASFDINQFYTSQNYQEKYYEKMEMFSPIFQIMQETGKGILRSVNRVLPYTFYISYEKLSLFRYYKWTYLTKGINPNFQFSDIVMPTQVLEVEKFFIKNIRVIPRTLFILDKGIFSSILNDIKYFFDRNLISEKELLILKSELRELISFIEELTATGSYKDGGEVTIFLSDIELDSTYAHIECDNNSYSLNWAYFIDAIIFDNPKMGQKQKEWIELLKRYSTLITQTGEIQRFEFFNKQRQLIDTFC